MEYYKTLNEDGSPPHGGGEWFLPQNGEPGKWMPRIDEIEPCRSGYHGCRRGDVVIWLKPRIFLMEYRAKPIIAGNKVVGHEARLISEFDTWNERTQRLFAADCALHILYLFEEQQPNGKPPREAIEAARQSASGLTTLSQLWAACAAAFNAARDARGAAIDAACAAGAAAGASAGGAARDAARDARDAAWNAAWNARDAAWNATREVWGARDAEREWQTRRLFEYLNGKRT